MPERSRPGRAQIFREPKGQTAEEMMIPMTTEMKTGGKHAEQIKQSYITCHVSGTYADKHDCTDEGLRR